MWLTANAGPHRNARVKQGWVRLVPGWGTDEFLEENADVILPSVMPIFSSLFQNIIIRNSFPRWKGPSSAVFWCERAHSSELTLVLTPYTGVEQQRAWLVTGWELASQKPAGAPPHIPWHAGHSGFSLQVGVENFFIDRALELWFFYPKWILSKIDEKIFQRGSAPGQRHRNIVLRHSYNLAELNGWNWGIHSVTYQTLEEVIHKIFQLLDHSNGLWHSFVTSQWLQGVMTQSFFNSSFT
jgi:hypothetical protein